MMPSGFISDSSLAFPRVDFLRVSLIIVRVKGKSKYRLQELKWVVCIWYTTQYTGKWANIQSICSSICLVYTNAKAKGAKAQKTISVDSSEKWAQWPSKVTGSGLNLNGSSLIYDILELGQDLGQKPIRLEFG
ncbi:hypothetical protein AABB24_010786 [Solanum stoloniferum]|uniref:Uncharacterized protein n=1 Tax=Solanum stoloniferum TaxID=62892 RepID=A0ABD2UAH3_9SOLN